MLPEPIPQQEGRIPRIPPIQSDFGQELKSFLESPKGCRACGDTKLCSSCRGSGFKRFLIFKVGCQSCNGTGNCPVCSRVSAP